MREALLMFGDKPANWIRKPCAVPPLGTVAGLGTEKSWAILKSIRRPDPGDSSCAIRLN